MPREGIVLKKVHELEAGDVLSGSGFLVLNVCDSIHCPPKKLEVTGSYPNETEVRRRYWRRDTQVGVKADG